MTAACRRAAMLVVALAVTTIGCSHAAQSGGAVCGMGRTELLAILRDRMHQPDMSLDRVDQQACASDWIFLRAEFVLSDGPPEDPTAILLHNTGGQWQLAYAGTAPLEPGDQLCTQMPPDIKRADDVFRSGCPA